MARCRTCEFCNASLDYGEVCDCRKPKEEDEKPFAPIQTVKKVLFGADNAALPSPGSIVPKEVVEEYRKYETARIKNNYVQVLPKFSEEARESRGQPTYTTFVKIGPLWQYCGNCFWGEVSPR